MSADGHWPTPRPAGELNDEEAAERRELCFRLDQQVKAAMAKASEALWHLAHALYEFDEANAWSALGYETKSHWLADPEISMTESRYYRLVHVWREVVVRRQVDLPTLGGLELTKVDIVLPAIAAQTVTLEDAFADVRALGARDLRIKHGGRAEPPPQPPTAHRRTSMIPAPAEPASHERGRAIELVGHLVEAVGTADEKAAWAHLVTILHGS